MCEKENRKGRCGKETVEMHSTKAGYRLYFTYKVMAGDSGKSMAGI